MRLEPGHAALVARALSVAVVVALPLRIVAQGFLPEDDALRHAAKAVSGKAWSEILVLRPDLSLDPSPGWHALLGVVHRLTGADVHALVLFSIVTLFVLVSVPALFVLRRPEAWLFSLAVMATADPGLVSRFFLGRPFLVTIALVVTVCLTWERLRAPRVHVAYLVGLVAFVAATTWIHGAWYLLIPPIAAFFLAREWRAGAVFAACVAAGVLAGAALTGHPVAFLAQAVRHAVLAVGGSQPTASLVREFQPFTGNATMMLAVVAVLGLRTLRAPWRPDVVRSPVFALMVLGWALGWLAVRFYMDWAVPAALVWMARQTEAVLEAVPGETPGGRVATAAAAAALCFLSIASDGGGGRWSRSIERLFLSAANAEHAPCFPRPGGILYMPDMSLFYRTFFRNPHGQWRYMLGFEPALMPAEDVATYNAIRRGDPGAFVRWVTKMTPADRLLVRSSQESPPPIAGLEWYSPAATVWCGQIPASGPP